MSFEQENKQFIFSTLEYFNNLYESNNDLVLNKEKLKQGIQSLEEAFGLQLSNDQHQNGYSLHSTNPNLSMSKLISTHIEFQTLGNHSDLNQIDPNLVAKFEQYVLKLHSTPYFKDIEKGSKQYNQRLIKAKEKFIKKYSTPKKQETQPPQQEFVEPEKVITEEDKKSADEWKNKGNQLFKEGKYEESIQCYSKAIEINETAIYYSNRAAAYQHLKKFQNIVDDCKRAIEIDPNYTKSYLRISSAFESLGKYEDAIVYYELLLKLEPNNQPAAEALQNARNKLKEKQPNMDFSSFLNDNNLRDLANNIQKKKEETPNEMPQSENPSFEDILSNPHILNMAQEAMKNNNFQQYLNNPNFMNMAQQMMSNPNQLNQFMSNLGMGGMGGMGGQSNPPKDPNNNNN